MEGVYKEACNVSSSYNEDASNDYEEACTVSPSRVSTTKRAAGLNLASDSAKEPGSSGSLSKRQATDPGTASAETAGYIPGVGLRSPAMKMSDLRLTVRKLDQETKRDLKDLKLSVSKLDTKAGQKEKKLQRLEKLEDNMKNKQDKPEKERAPIRLPATCPDGYKKYHEICYKAFQALKTFSKSAETCRADGGTLAMPRDAGIHDFLVSLMKQLLPLFDYWIGLHDERQEGKWEWIDGTALGTGYNRWKNGQPNNHGGNQDCALYWGSGRSPSSVFCCSRQVTGRPHMREAAPATVVKRGFRHPGVKTT
ncbi:PREDICTED: C-type lectin domain family 3 member A-like [Branchiostoma belcheri]|uniref:C-type lectin domain family 3 member A-like n=1 Tax=Branchiostoma belcheri TaxID=7741 RepID=A0A6P5A1F1_BRABE|nr:PREDICTED: C-type lectin domain family 3 member A-like [Branchiostoma belcheri]